MSDIVKMWEEELDSLGGKPMNAAEIYANDLAGLVKSLRQRVAELEQENIRLKTAWDSAYERAMLNGELATKLEAELAAITTAGCRT